MDIRIAETDEDIAACYAVMRELRPQVAEAEFLPQVRRQQAQGFHLAALYDGARPVAVAGYRHGENLHAGRYLYVDDLVTLASERSRGHGAALLAWLREQARAAGCVHFHLDSGVQRKDAHRFYEREGLALSSYHFSCAVPRE